MAEIEQYLINCLGLVLNSPPMQSPWIARILTIDILRS